jgi:hypothetical protein
MLERRTHAWDGIVIVDEHTQVAFTVDLFIQPGRAEAVVRDDRSALSVQLYKTFWPAARGVLAAGLDHESACRRSAPGHGAALTGSLGCTIAPIARCG